MGVIRLLGCEEMASWPIWEQSRFPNEVTKCTCHFWWEISLKSVFLVGAFNIGSCNRRHGLMQSKRSRQASALPASSGRKVVPSCIKDKTQVSLKVYWWEKDSADTWFSSPAAGEKEVFKSKQSAEREKIISGASKSVFQACSDFASCQRFLETATLLDLFYLKFF